MNDTSKKSFNKWLTAFANNLILYLITFYIVIIAYNIATVFMAKLFGINMILNYDKINFITPMNSSQWNTSSVIATFISGPIILLVLGIVFYTLFSKYKRKKGMMKVFFLWGYLHSFNYLFVTIIVGILTNRDFGWISSWLFFSDFFKISIIFISIFILVFIGYYHSKYFFVTTFSYSFIENRKKRIIYLIFCIVIPALIGNSIFSLVNYSNTAYYNYTFFSILLFLLPAFRNKKSFHHIRITKDPIGVNIVWGWAIVLALTAFLYRLILGFGINL